MLILSRKEGETIVVGGKGQIRIKIVNLKGNYVRIGIEAPENVDIYRAEIEEKYKHNRLPVRKLFC